MIRRPTRSTRTDTRLPDPALFRSQRTVGDMVDAEGGVDSTGALFQLLDTMPLAGITTVMVMVLVAIFFVSGADAASIVMGSLSEKRSEEHTSELQSLMRISYAVFCLKKKN